MKKTLILIFALCMMLPLVSCGGTASILDDVSTDYESNKLPITDVSETSNTTDGYDSDVASNSDQNIPLFPVDALSMKKTATMQEQLIYDHDDIKITAKKLEYTNDRIKLTVIIENNSSKDLSFLAGTFSHSCNSVNGYMVQDGYLNVDISAGKKSIETITFDYEELYLYGIQEIADITISILYHPKGEYTSSYTGSLKIETSITNTYKYEKTYTNAIKDKDINNQLDIEVLKYEDISLFSSDSFKVLSYAFVNKDSEKRLLIEFENNVQYLNAYIKDLCINGLVVSNGSVDSIELDQNKRGVLDLSIGYFIEKKFYESLIGAEITSLSFDIEVKTQDGVTVIPDQNVEIKIADNNDVIDISGEEVYNANGIRVIHKGIFYEDVSFGDDYHIVYLIENKASKELIISDVNDSLSVNGFMIDSWVSSSYIKHGKYGLFIIPMDSKNLEEIYVTKLDEIQTYEVGVEIKDVKYNTIDIIKIKH